MPSLIRILFIAPAILAVAHGQGLITKAQGTNGSPASLPLQLDQTSSADANIINTNEITQNIVNECGRTLLAGNIDIGENTETQLANKTVTSVTKGGNVEVTIRPVNASGAGPYTCDMDQTSNSIGATGQTKLVVTEKDSTSATGDITLSVTMPADMACVGASTGNICTIRCFNSNAAGPFGGCIAVQQTDVTPSQNSPNQLKTAQSLSNVNAQVAVNQADLPAAIAANAGAGGTEKEQGLAGAEALLAIETTAPAAVAVATATGAATAATSAATKGNGKKGAGNAAKGGANAATGKGGKGATNAAGAKGGKNAARAFAFIS